MLLVLTPPLDRFMDTVDGAELLASSLVEISLLVATEAEPGELALVLGDPRRAVKRRPVNIVVGIRLYRVWSVEGLSPGERIAAGIETGNVVADRSGRRRLLPASGISTRPR